ncbi:13324_t:CDS:2 [Ambispora leptoticha]|uniref:13324_t:CDS:1 n=1 Tax=Ambispora leptoticha TaxID=144679 RepID=A0A9N9BZD1_9GLOM|nr:13324_t:CDS:2 [Ambispora leptoticha]
MVPPPPIPSFYNPPTPPLGFNPSATTTPIPFPVLNGQPNPNPVFNNYAAIRTHESLHSIHTDPFHPPSHPPSLPQTPTAEPFDLPKNNNSTTEGTGHQPYYVSPVSPVHFMPNPYNPELYYAQSYVLAQQRSNSLTIQHLNSSPPSTPYQKPEQVRYVENSTGNENKPQVTDMQPWPERQIERKSSKSSNLHSRDEHQNDRSCSLMCQQPLCYQGKPTQKFWLCVVFILLILGIAIAIVSGVVFR